MQTTISFKGAGFRLLLCLILLLSVSTQLGAALSDEPGIEITAVNASEVGQYEKYEIFLDLSGVEIDNPYDPEDIDVYAIFTSPTGEIIRINAFYDDFEKADQWKLRFSPGETGEYKYRLFVKDGNRSGHSNEATFMALPSSHKGWIRQSSVNPHYFMHDDGSTYYGVGVYSPWRNNMERFETFAEHKANLFAIWDITYGGFVNGTGLIEEELGKYNQMKLGRIDSMLRIFEENDIKLMYAIWPHDLFSKTVWAAQWKLNPYNQLVDVDDVYSDSLVWKYQKRKYRYLIARFGHSRSMGIWELINEMNGTDGWAHGRHQECYDWVSRSVKYFKDNDPYKHPVTASFSGGFEEYREELYKRTDIPNIHVYPAQGWKMKYPEDTMRSAMYNYAWAAKRFWDNFEKPSIFGEAGAGLAYYKPKEAAYHEAYHHQIWASLVNGLAATPVWWDYPVLTDEDWDQLEHLATFVRDIDFANKHYKPMDVSSSLLDAYVMGTGEEAFGWARDTEGLNCAQKLCVIEGFTAKNFEIVFYDTWNGKEHSRHLLEATDGILSVTLPESDNPKPDMAFKIKPYAK